MFRCLNTSLTVGSSVGWGDRPFRKWSLGGGSISQGIQGMDVRVHSLSLLPILSLVALGRWKKLCRLATHATVSSVTVVLSSVFDAGLHPSGTVSQNRIFLPALITVGCCDKNTETKCEKDFFITVSWFQRDELSTAESRGSKWAEQSRAAERWHHWP